jgi:hypothetical protein
MGNRGNRAFSKRFVKVGVSIMIWSWQCKKQVAGLNGARIDTPAGDAGFAGCGNA